MLDGNNKRAMKNTEVIEKIGKELFVKLEQHSWGGVGRFKTWFRLACDLTS